MAFFSVHFVFLVAHQAIKLCCLGWYEGFLVIYSLFDKIDGPSFHDSMTLVDMLDVVFCFCSFFVHSISECCNNYVMTLQQHSTTLL